MFLTEDQAARARRDEEARIVGAIPFKQGRSAAEYRQTVRRRLVAAGYVPARAPQDAGGNCLECGEAGRCPGYHIEGGAAMAAPEPGR